jgi:hypothetical protein
MYYTAKKSPVKVEIQNCGYNFFSSKTIVGVGVNFGVTDLLFLWLRSYSDYVAIDSGSDSDSRSLLKNIKSVVNFPVPKTPKQVEFCDVMLILQEIYSQFCCYCFSSIWPCGTHRVFNWCTAHDNFLHILKTHLWRHR